MGINADQKVAGVLIPVFALRREGDLKIGDTLAFKDAVDFCSRNKIAVLQTLPINETSGDNSPYNAISSMAVEPVLLSMEPNMVPGLTSQDLQKARESVVKLNDSIIDYRSIKVVKLNLLISAHKRLRSSSSEFKNELKEFEAFKAENASWLEPYSLFRALMELNGGSPVWTEWSEDIRSYESARKWSKSCAEREKCVELQDLYSYIQWVGDTQWRAVKEHADKLNVRIMGDIPFGVSRYSSDVWHNQELFDLELSGGAPPEPVFHGDEFTKRWGQNWGIPLYRWDVHRKEDFQWWRRRISRLMDHFHDFRIDHVLGFFRVYAFPWTPDRNGEFLPLTETEALTKTGGILPGFSPRDDESEENREKNRKEGSQILEAVADTASGGAIVAEDLGLIVPPYVRPAIHKLNMAGFAIPIFERDEETREFVSMDKLHPLSLATYATHDHQPIKSYYEELVKWWHGENGHEGWLEVQRLMRLLGRDQDSAPESFEDDLLFDFERALLCDSSCWLAVMMISDLLGLDLRFNQPGLSGGECWTLRLDRELKDFEEDERFGRRISRFRELIVESGRANRVTAGSL